MKNRKIYFLGIGGIGMSAIAQYFLQNDCEVYGYDLTESPITQFLCSKGAKIHYSPDVSSIPKDIDFVIYTPAVPEDFPEYQYFVDNKVQIYKRSKALGMITDNYKTVAVAGTHGKTTTTSMVAHLMNSSKHSLLAFIGGISKNLNDNYLYRKLDDDVFAVVEADEFDRSFLTLHPYVSVITSMDADHLDIYGDSTRLVEAFQQFADQSQNVFVEEKIACKINKDNGRKFVYGLGNTCDSYPYNIHFGNEFTTFDLHTPFCEIKSLKIQLHGIYNVLNATAAISAFLLSLSPFEDGELQHCVREVVKGMEEFSGVKRRFDYIIKREDFVYIDDYAHHPKEMSSFFNAVKELYPGKRICAVFQPHLYSRTRDFAEDFAKALSIPDEVILLPIYPAREKPIPGITSDFLLEKIDGNNKLLLQKHQLFDYLKDHKPDVLLTVGAGDIDRLVPKLSEL